MHIFFEKRLYSSGFIRIAITICAIIFALLAGGVFLYTIGVNPFSAYSNVCSQIFTNKWGIEDLLLKMSPLMLTGISVALAAKMRLWNIGADGQFYMGACAATWVALTFGGSGNSLMLLPLMFLAGVTAGALWIFIPAFFKAHFNVNDIITTLLMNYIAISLVDYFLFGSWRDPNSLNFPITALFPPAAALPMIKNINLHIGFLIGIFIILLIYFFLEKSRFGIYVNIVGNNPNAAQYSGVNKKRLIILIMMISGAIAGLAGVIELTGVHHRLQQNISLGYGYTGIIVTWLSRAHPLGVIFNAFFMAFIFVGGEIMQMSAGIPVAMIYLFQGIILFSVLGSDVFAEYKLKIKKTA
ncbi:MAG: ABC transporter permease [Deltaproteobacteria bacterium]|nr:ABC transporter permease [Deltaproteobacteria bacterium]